MKRSTKNRALAAGAAAAGLAVVAAAGIAVSRRAGSEVVYHVRPDGDEGWVVVTEGSDTPVTTHATKREAVTAARRLAGEHAPSQLVIHKIDATVQARHRYRVDA